MYCLCMSVKYSNISKQIKFSHFNLIVSGAQDAEFYKRGGNKVAYLFIFRPTLLRFVFSVKTNPECRDLKRASQYISDYIK